MKWKIKGMSLVKGVSRDGIEFVDTYLQAFIHGESILISQIDLDNRELCE